MLALCLALALAATPDAAGQGSDAEVPALPTVEATFEHDLATPNGVVPLTWPALAYDRVHREVFVTGEGFVRIFDESGMESHRFGDDGSLGNVQRAVVLDDGSIVVLSLLDGRRAYLRCDFRGELLARFGLSGLPKDLDDFQPDQLVHQGGKLYFAERGTMRVVVTDTGGAFVRTYRLRDLVNAAIPPDYERRGLGAMDAFNVDAKGNLLVTMSTMFGGAVISPSGEVRLFGSRGSRPGKFNIVGGIDADEQGNVYVADRLRSIVSVWDPELRFLGEFGYRGSAPWSLLTPFELVVGNGHVFVAQAGQKGVKVYRVRLIEPEPADAPPPLGARQ